MRQSQRFKRKANLNPVLTMNTFKIKRRNSSSKHSLILITIVLRNKLRPIRHIEIFTDFDSGFIE
jgi:hypothetical protein